MVLHAAADRDEPEEKEQQFLSFSGLEFANEAIDDSHGHSGEEVINALGRQATLVEIMAFAKSDTKQCEEKDNKGRVWRCTFETVEDGTTFRYKFGLLADSKGHSLMHKSRVIRRRSPSAAFVTLKGACVRPLRLQIAIPARLSRASTNELIKYLKRTETVLSSEDHAATLPGLHTEIASKNQTSPNPAAHGTIAHRNVRTTRKRTSHDDEDYSHSSEYSRRLKRSRTDMNYAESSDDEDDEDTSQDDGSVSSDNA